MGGHLFRGLSFTSLLRVQAMAVDPESYATLRRWLTKPANSKAARADAAALAAASTPTPAPPVQKLAGGRDLRLDLFRGIALWLIFLDHIPENIVNLFTLRNYGFSDATEIFIFISGYTAAFVYGRAMRERGFIVSGARILRRAWQIYVAHIFLFTIFMAEIAYVAATFSNPLFAEEMNILGFLKQPDVTIFEALLLKFKPVNMDVLPLYIVLLLLFPPVLRVLLWQPAYALAGAALVYVLALHFDINLPAYPNGVWLFNPFAWQILFVFGAWCAVGGAQRLTGLLRSRIVFALAIAYLLFAFGITLTWRFESLQAFVPNWLGEFIYPIDKTNLDVLRFAHFLALAAITVRFVSHDWPGLKSPLLRPAIRCGQHSLEIFCLGVFLAFAGQFIIGEWSGGPLVQTAISVAGILIMIATASLISWYKNIEGRSHQQRTTAPPANLAGGEA
ncbi:MAG TPA: OpgC domain-containing protein [Xanthobacteraceae bacterium]|nr:OpgC domain-containing protein [Xanthobacteraceae bacterium]